MIIKEFGMLKWLKNKFRRSDKLGYCICRVKAYKFNQIPGEKYGELKALISMKFFRDARDSGIPKKNAAAYFDSLRFVIIDNILGNPMIFPIGQQGKIEIVKEKKGLGA